MPADEAPRVVVPSPGVAREIHRDMVRDERARWLKRAPAVPLAVGIWIWAGGGHVETFSFFLVGLSLFWTATAVNDWWQLRTADPVEAVTAERRLALEQAQHEARLVSTTLAMTYVLVGAISCVWVFQVLTGGINRSIFAAGLVKQLARRGQWWRLITATYLHGNLIHFWSNMAAIRTLGETIETYDRRLRLPLVYVLSALGGSVVTTVFVVKTSVGASGGIMGLCGYLFMLASRQPGVAPAWIRRWMLAAFAGMGVLGLFGFFFIDNAAHIGGALSGLACGAAMIPAENRPQTPARVRLLDGLGWLAAVLIVAGAVLTIRKLA